MMNLADTEHLDRDHKVITVVLQDEFRHDSEYMKKGKKNIFLIF